MKKKDKAHTDNEGERSPKTKNKQQRRVREVHSDSERDGEGDLGMDDLRELAQERNRVNSSRVQKRKKKHLESEIQRQDKRARDRERELTPVQEREDDKLNKSELNAKSKRYDVSPMVKRRDQQDTNDLSKSQQRV